MMDHSPQVARLSISEGYISKAYQAIPTCMKGQRILHSSKNSWYFRTNILESIRERLEMSILEINELL